MKKIIVSPKIHVYRDVFKSPEEIFNFVKGTDHNLPWKEWAGLWKGKALKIPSSYASTDYDENSLFFLNQIIEAFNTVSDDYLESYKGEKFWPEFIKEWEGIRSKPWVIDDTIDFLKYNKEQSDDLKTTKLAMNYHTDYNNFNENSPEDKKVITVTMYLNDEYDGGEISMYCPPTNKLYNYKPKAGDITVFPSGRDYYHGVLPFSGDDRYLVRMFKSYQYEGSDDWWRDRDYYGHKTWDDMEKEKVKKIWEDGSNLINIVKQFEEPNDPRLKSIYLDSDPIYMNGKEYDN